MLDNNYINIQGWMRSKLNLTDNKLIMFAIIYGFSQDGKSRCKASLTYFEDAIGKSRKTVIATRDKLIEDNLIIMHKGNITDNAEYEVNHRYLAGIQTTPPNLIASVKTPLALVEELHQPSEETTLVASVKTPHNTNIYNNTNINNTNSVHATDKKTQIRNI